MAGTRLRIQSIVLLELLALVLWSLHVGFCRPKRQQAKGGLPQLLPPIETDILCPWPHVEKLWSSSGGDDDATTVPQSTSIETASEVPQVKFVLVLEDASALPTWAAILEKELQFPSYLADLEDISVKMPFDVKVVLPFNHHISDLSESTVQEIWKHLAASKAIGDDAKEHRVVLYISKTTDSYKHVDVAVDQNGTMPDPPPPPLVWSYQLQLPQSSSSSRTWMLLPTTTTNLNGELGALLEEFTFQSVVDICGKQEHGKNNKYEDEMMRFWWCLAQHWKAQTLCIEQHSLEQGIVNETIHVPTFDDNEDNKNHSIASLQRAVAQWQQKYADLQRLYLQRTGIKYHPSIISKAKPQPLRQDFPLEHYAAIFMPLLFPLLVPFLVSTIKEYKRYREKKRKKKETEASGKDDSIPAKKEKES